MKTVGFFGVMAVLCGLLILAMIGGCVGSGGMGGQGFHIVVTQGVPGAGVDGQPVGNSSVITITNTDGGTLQNPSVAVEPKEATPQTQPEQP